mgnify:CR=1
MAVNKRNRVYKLTPRRRAALKKAQAASARKRSRRRGTVALGVVGATIIAGGATYVGHRYVQGLRGGPQKPNVVNVTTPKASEPRQLGTIAGKGIDLRRVAPLKTGKNWKIVGRAFKVTQTQKKVRHIEHDRMWTKNRKLEATRSRRAKAERKRYRLKSQANGTWRKR